MMREVALEDISDGKLYGLNDMVKADCQGCKGCSSCCRGMGESIILTPLDVFRLETGLKKSFGELMVERISLHVVDGLILPNLNMDGDGEECTFLNEEGRCGIHTLRPDICRLFPLGRYYEEDGFRYFLQVNECEHKNRLKIKVKKWLDIPNLNIHEKYILDWHDYLKRMGKTLEDVEEERRRDICMKLLKLFYIRPYNVLQDFYAQFYMRLEEGRIL